MAMLKENAYMRIITGAAIAALLAVGILAAPAEAKTKKPPVVVFTQNGSGTAQTAVFKVPSSWNLAWTYDCSKSLGSTGNFIVSIYDFYGQKSQLDFDNQGVNQLGASGAGTEHYYSGGNKKYLKIVSECDWGVTVTKK